jgi:DNA-directed RNA polymerase subunit H
VAYSIAILERLNCLVKRVIEKSKFNLFEHNLVPRHEILTDSEIEELQNKYHIKLYQLPYIKLSDPVVEFIGAKPGDILRITRKSLTAGSSVTYRYVVEG